MIMCLSKFELCHSVERIFLGKKVFEAWESFANDCNFLKRISERVSKEAESYGMFDFLLHVAAKDKADSTDDLNRKFSKKESGKERSFAHLDKVSNLLQGICCMDSLHIDGKIYFSACCQAAGVKSELDKRPEISISQSNLASENNSTNHVILFPTTRLGQSFL